jgi:hypothetical protein
MYKYATRKAALSTYFSKVRGKKKLNAEDAYIHEKAERRGRSGCAKVAEGTTGYWVLGNG